MVQTAAARRLNRAQVVDEAFVSHLQALAAGRVPVRATGTIAPNDLLELFESQMSSRQLDLMARVKRAENKVF